MAKFPDCEKDFMATLRLNAAEALPLHHAKNGGITSGPFFADQEKETDF